MNSDDDFAVLEQVLSLIRPMSPERRVRLVKTLSTLLSVNQDATESTHGAGPAFTTGSGGSGGASRADRANTVPYSQDLSASPKQFLMDKQPKSDVERIACLAYYLTHYRDMPHFKTIDLSKLNTEAAQPRLSNTNYASKNALNQGYLAQAVKGTRQLSAAGEQFVNSLPDRAAAKAVMATALKRRRSKPKTRAK